MRTKKQPNWGYFDGCEICKAMRNADEVGKSLSMQELEMTFQKANDQWSADSTKTFVFDVIMLDRKSKILRFIACPSSFSLYQLAEFIIDSFGFNFDHAFGFFEKEDIYKSSRKYELFTDLISEGEDLEPTGAESVKHTKLSEVWHKVGHRMFFIFDYGDSWMFEITLQEIGEKSSAPTLLKSKGKAPKQYS